MTSNSPKTTRTPSQTPVRGRGRGRPRLYQRGTSTASRRKASTPAPKTPEGTPTGRRRGGGGVGGSGGTYSNGYRPGGAGGGGRYLHPSTGEEIPATVYRDLIKKMKSEGGGGGSGGGGTVARRAAAAMAQTPVMPLPKPPPVGPDGVYKPREERSYTEFHPGFDVDQPLLVLHAQEVDGENYKPPVLPDGTTKTVKIVDIKEEEEMRKDMAPAGSIKEESQGERSASIAGSAPSESSSHRARNTTEDYNTKKSATSPVSLTSNGVSTATHTDYDPVSATSSSANRHVDLFPYGLTNDLPIDPSLTALTPPPLSMLDPALSVPIDPALSAPDAHPPPAQTQTPAATPTDGPLKDESVTSAPTPPPTTPAAPEVVPSPTKRGLSDVPTLASLRAHRTTAGKPPPRAPPPPSTRKPRSQNQSQNPHEKLHLRAPSFRQIQSFTFAHRGLGGSSGSGKGPHKLGGSQPYNEAPMSDKMIAIGYQHSTHFECPPNLIRDQPDVTVDEELSGLGLDVVEYDMDEQDDKWLTNYNSHRMITGDDLVDKEMFEFAMTKIEKEWVNLEKKMPKIQAKPHGVGMSNRRRSSGRAGEEDDDEGAEDSKCAICDDGECENANAIVFCDGCNLAVHQECYGVPYIPEGQWHCRKCQQIPRQVAHCVFCPNIDGAFKQTNTNRWAHLLCAIWIPEVRLANPSFMEPVEGVELVPKSRWKLNCYICKQKMGACIQCSNRNCFLAFHVTCGRRARLHMKMKNTSGSGAQLESSGLKALCHKHVPPDWRKENEVDAATEDAMNYYANSFTGREWGDSHAAAMARSGASGVGDFARAIHKSGDKRKHESEQRTVWKLQSGAPVIPVIILDVIIDSLVDFGISNTKNFAVEACKYWTLKREARRGASLVRRFQVQADSNSFTSSEVIRKNYAALGHTQGGKKLERRRDFSGSLEKDLVGMIGVVKAVGTGENSMLREAEVLGAYFDRMYFPELPLMREVLDGAQKLDQETIFEYGFGLIRDRIEARLYPNVSAFIADMRSVLRSSSTDPHLEFDIRASRYIQPQLPPSSRLLNEEDVKTIGGKIMDALEPSFKKALKKQEELWDEMAQRPAKRPRLLEQFNGTLFDVPVNGTAGSLPNSPSLQLVKEALPEPLKNRTSIYEPLNLPKGGTIIGALAKTVAGEWIVGSIDTVSQPWQPRDHSASVTELDNEPSTLGNGKSSYGSVLAPEVARSPSAENPSGVLPDKPVDSSIVDEDHGMEDAPADEEMEDAPGDPDDEFLLDVPPTPVPTELVPPVRMPVLPLDLHDEDAEGEIDDEMATQYTVTSEVPEAINPAPATTTTATTTTTAGGATGNLSDVDDSMHDGFATDDDLLGGYRGEDLPSPLGTILGSSAVVPTSTTKAAGAVAASSPPRSRGAQARDPMIDLPDLPPNNGSSTTATVDLEALSNTSVLSDYPDDLDENADVGVGAGSTGDENNEGENENISPPSRSRKSARETNGRFGNTGAGTSRKKRR